MQLKIVETNHELYRGVFEEMAPAMRKACHEEGLPYLECMPTFKGYILMTNSWALFREEYIKRVREACHYGVASIVDIK